MYACQVWHTNLKKTPHQPQNIQKRTMCIIFHEMCFNDAIVVARRPTLTDRREALCRTLFASMQQPNHKLHHLPPPPGHLIMQSVMHVLTVFLAVGPNVLRTFVSYTDCTIGSNWIFLFTCGYYLSWTVNLISYLFN